MAPEKKEKKRKDAPVVVSSSEGPQKKLKKQKSTKEPDLASNVSKAIPNATSDAVPPAVAEMNHSDVKSKKDRKRAADFLSDNEENAAVHEVPQETAAKPKNKAKKVKSEQIETVKAPVVEASEAQLAPNVKPHKKAKVPKVPESDDVPAKAAKKTKIPVWPTKAMTEVVNKVVPNGDPLTADGVNGILEHSGEEDVELTTANKEPSTSMQDEAQRTVEREMADEAATEDESGDQGAALLAGFDSDGDDSGEDEGLDPADMADLNLNKQQRKKLRQATRKGSKEGPGTVYVGRVPRGFYETQMRQYFSQFGTITNLRLSRNKTTGASKHFAFIEFESNEVAKIVAQTMDNYLMFGHILKCKYAPSESLHADTWKGANKRFKKVPYNKIEKRKLEEPKTKDQWEGKIAREQGKREKKLSKAQSMGYDYELPQIQGVDAALERKKLGQQEESNTIEPAAEVQEPTGAIEPLSGVPEDAVTVKGRQRKRNKAKSRPATENADTEILAKSLSGEADPPQKENKANKTNKVEAASGPILPTTLTEAPVETAAENTKPNGGKRAKKTKKAAVTSEATVPTANVEAQSVAPVPATKVIKPVSVETKNPGKKAKKGVIASPASIEASSSTGQPEAEPPKFAFHPDEIAELTKPKDNAKAKAKKQKKSKGIATDDAAAAQMQLNAELNGAVEPLKDEGAESDVEIAATTAVLPTPGGGERKAGKKTKVPKMKKRKLDVGAGAGAGEGPNKIKKMKKAAA